MSFCVIVEYDIHTPINYVTGATGGPMRTVLRDTKALANYFKELSKSRNFPAHGTIKWHFGAIEEIT